MSSFCVKEKGQVGIIFVVINIMPKRLSSPVLNPDIPIKCNTTRKNISVNKLQFSGNYAFLCQHTFFFKVLYFSITCHYISNQSNDLSKHMAELHGCHRSKVCSLTFAELKTPLPSTPSSSRRKVINPEFPIKPL